MIYPGLFKARYPVLRGKDWIRTISPDDLKFFIKEGMKAWDYGKMGGAALVEKRGREYMSKIGRIGAIVANSKRAWNKALLEEMWREGIMK